ncbi:NADPH:quinone reductase [Amycolatopsis antarctica]|uniref:NADPH:quinone reductase n=1 Tax=Amycolatopsis antarctica TaxID=1854586 RepID=A0A263DB65_9PSEU|nr:NAD(P)H-dependent oxidoreductase [Amycolatopsis antarctica]OZM74625.1 NADPH:quinone reductase [Amycolatopsis antarctica]
MKVLWVFAHPEPRSLGGALRDEGVRVLHADGHEVRQSDLYAMRWDPVVGAADFDHDPADRLLVGAAAQRAHAAGALRADIRSEQDKLVWADTVVVQFPLWWYAMPAILKGWFDRVFVQGFAFGVRDPATGRTLRYGEGTLTGKRAMVVVSAGAREVSLGPRGVNGQLDELLFPLQHGTLWYSGMSVVPPLLVPSADRADTPAFAAAAARLAERLRGLPVARPIPFRRQNGGDYDEDLVLRPDIAAGRHGLSVHLAAAAGVQAPSAPITSVP